MIKKLLFNCLFNRSKHSTVKNWHFIMFLSFYYRNKITERSGNQKQVEKHNHSINDDLIRFVLLQEEIFERWKQQTQNGRNFVERGNLRGNFCRGKKKLFAKQKKSKKIHLNKIFRGFINLCRKIDKNWKISLNQFKNALINTKKCLKL